MKKIYALILILLVNYSLQAQDDPDLLGTWYLHYVEAFGSTTYAPYGSNYEMAITNSGDPEAISGNSTCNSFVSDYEILNNNSSIHINSYTETLGFCDDPFEGLHLGVMSSSLSGNFDYVIDLTNESLTMTNYLGRKLVYGRQVLSVKDNEAFSNNIKIYPNPAKSKLFISGAFMNAKTTYTVYDLVGKTIITESSLQQDHIDVSILNTGVYFLKTKTDGKFSMKKFIKL